MRYQTTLASFAVFTAYTLCINASNKTDIQELKQRMQCVEGKLEESTKGKLEERTTCCDCETRYCSSPDYNPTFFVSGEALYWNVAERGLTYGIRAKYAVPANNNTLPSNEDNDILGGKALHPHFDWHWGFRVGAGFNMCYGDWELYSDWTRFHFGTHKSNSFLPGPDELSGNPNIDLPNTAGTTVIFPTWIPKIFQQGLPASCFTASTFWRVHLDVVDLQLGREFYAAKWLVLRPHIGLRMGWINQKYDIDYRAPLIPPNGSGFSELDYQIDMKNNFWGVGIIGGLDSDWCLGAGFSIYGNAALSILDGHFKTDLVFNYDAINSAIPRAIVAANEYTTGSHQHEAIPIIDLALGMRWDYSWCDSFHLGLWAGFEQHIFFDQNQFLNHQFDFSLESVGLPGYYTDGGSLTTSGFVFGLEFGF